MGGGFVTEFYCLNMHLMQIAFCFCLFFFLSLQSVTCNQGPSIAYQRKPFIKLCDDGGERMFFLYFDSLNVRDEEEILLDSAVG